MSFIHFLFYLAIVTTLFFVYFNMPRVFVLFFNRQEPALALNIAIVFFVCLFFDASQGLKVQPTKFRHTSGCTRAIVCVVYPLRAR